MFISKVLITSTVGLLLYIIKLIYPWIVKTWQINQVLKKYSLPFKYRWPLGHLAGLPEPNHEWMMTSLSFTRSMPRMFTMYISSFKPILGLVHPETVKVLLQTAEPKPVSGFGPYRLVSSWLGDGLLVSSGRKWARNRKLLTPGFHFNILKSYVSHQNQCAEILVERILATDGCSVEISQLVKACTLDILIKCLFSSCRTLQINDEENYLSIVEEVTGLILKRAYNPVMYIDTLYYLTQDGKRFKELVHKSRNQVNELMRNRREELKSFNISPHQLETNTKIYERNMDFLDILLLARDEQDEGLTDEEIVDEVLTFKFEGHDTTASGLSFILYNLAKHPEHQKLVQKELDDVLGSKSDIGWEDTKKLPYLTMCIKESLRMYPPVQLICRQLENPLTIDGETIPAGAYVDVPIWNLHHNHVVWGEDHMEYRPERFSQENIKNIDPFAFIAFSAGPRNCIGQNFAMNDLLIIISHVLRRFDLQLDENHDMRIVPGLVLGTENGIKIHFSVRN